MKYSKAITRFRCLIILHLVIEPFAVFLKFELERNIKDMERAIDYFQIFLEKENEIIEQKTNQT